MFTFGIFTTHIPYIAFVVFYAFFLVSGINKATSGEIPSGENSLLLETSAGTTFTYTNTNNPSDFYYHAGVGQFPPGDNDVLVFKRTLRQKNYFLSKSWSCHVNSSLFSRPPPYLF